jgi:ABC-type uncharacterized transport system ATPase subunit
MAETGMPPPAVEMRAISVRFGPVTANEDVTIAVRPGEILGLLGENGAGKTTLMRVLAGLIQPDSGDIRIDGRPTVIADPQAARRLGIGMVHQHFMLIDTMSVAENVALGLPGLRRFFPDMGKVAREIATLGERHGLKVDGRAKIADLSVASQQRVEILKALYRGARILVLDEPTAVLTPQESAALFPVLRGLAAAGTAIIFISHKLNEVLAVTDRISVLRRGRVAGTLVTADTTETEIARLMVGADVALPVLDGAVSQAGAPVLRVTDARLKDTRGVAVLDDVSLAVRPGEIVGIAGVDGNGQQELAEAVVGLLSLDRGQIELGGRDMTRADIATRIGAGVAHIPEDRLKTAIFSSMSVNDNIVAEQADSPRFQRSGFRRQGEIARYAADLIARFDVRLGSATQPIGSLSGGNQQKVVLGRALLRDPKLIVAVQPTRGLDIGATAFLHAQLLERRAAGAGILLVSTELDEVLALSDRIVVMFKGRVAGTLARAEFSTERLGLMMAGAA